MKKVIFLVKDKKIVECQLRDQIQYIAFTFLTVDNLVSKKSDNLGC